MKKMISTIFVVLALVLLNISTVFADNGASSNVNVTFIVLTCVLAPVLVGVIVYYSLKAKKAKNTKKEEEKIKIIRDYENK